MIDSASKLCRVIVIAETGIKYFVKKWEGKRENRIWIIIGKIELQNFLYFPRIAVVDSIYNILVYRITFSDSSKQFSLPIFLFR